ILFLALFALVLCAAPKLRAASELKLKFEAGWGPGYTLHINFETGEMLYALEKEPEAEQKPNAESHKLINHKNVGLYVKVLVKRIPEDHPGGIFGDDVPVYHITYTDGAFTRRFRIGSLYPPSAIHLNEGYSAEKELADSQAFAKSIDSY